LLLGHGSGGEHHCHLSNGDEVSLAGEQHPDTTDVHPEEPKGTSMEYAPEIVKGGHFEPPIEVAGPNVDVRQMGRKHYRVSKHAGARKKRAKAKRRRR